MEKVLYIHPGMNLHSRRYSIMPVGVVGLMNMFQKAGWLVKGINHPLELSLDSTYEVSAAVRDFRPDIVFMDLHWYVHTAGAMQLAELVRAVAPQSLIVVGGITASLFARELLHAHPAVDAVVRGYAEHSIREIIAACVGCARCDLRSIPGAVTRQNDRMIRSQTRSDAEHGLYEDLDYVDISWLVNSHRYYQTSLRGYRERMPSRYWLHVGRGCVHNCSMCGGGSRALKQFDDATGPQYRSVDKIVHDVLVLQNKGIQQVAFSQDVFADHALATSLLRGLKRHQLKMGLYHEYSVLPAEDVVREIYQVFDADLSEAVVSVETGSEEVRRRNFPGKYRTNDELHFYCRLFSGLCRRTAVYFAANLPWESSDTWEETIDFTKLLYRECRDRRVSSHVRLLTIDPMSPMWNDPGRYEIVREFAGAEDYYRMGVYGDRVPGYRSNHLSPAEAEENVTRHNVIKMLWKSRRKV